MQAASVQWGGGSLWCSLTGMAAGFQGWSLRVGGEQRGQVTLAICHHSKHNSSSYIPSTYNHLAPSSSGWERRPRLPFVGGFLCSCWWIYQNTSYHVLLRLTQSPSAFCAEEFVPTYQKCSTASRNPTVPQRPSSRGATDLQSSPYMTCWHAFFPAPLAAPDSLAHKQIHVFLLFLHTTVILVVCWDAWCTLTWPDILPHICAYLTRPWVNAGKITQTGLLSVRYAFIYRDILLG